MSRWEHFWHAVAEWAERHVAHHHKKKHPHHKHHRLRFVTLTLRQVCGG